MSVKRWRTRAADEKAVKKLCAALGISTLAARTLVARGASTPELASELIAGNIEIESPLALRDIDRAAVRINDAIDSEETIGVFGDYDVDGLTSTTLMLNYLFSRGANAVCSLPARDASGYGLSLLALDNMKKAGVSLIITVDNGITAHEEIAYASSLGIDVVVCDHHLPAETLPGAYAVVDPLRSDDESAFKELAGVGVALKLAAATEGCSADELLEEYGYLVALGTVSDVMPLVGENRAMVRLGIDQLHSCDNLGLRALCKSAGVNIESIDAQGVAFTIAPRLNAAGRMGSAETALRLLLSEDVDEAIEIADEL
ncbi:MAG: DHH family phosphoesterase, partial [Oscillospiraceae bacterium]